MYIYIYIIYIYIYIYYIYIIYILMALQFAVIIKELDSRDSNVMLEVIQTKYFQDINQIKCAYKKVFLCLSVCLFL